MSRRRLGALSLGLLAVLLLGALFRFGRIGAGLPGVFLADEELVMKNALSLPARRTLAPLYHDYPTFMIYLLSALEAGLYVAGRALGAYASPADFAARFVADPTPMYLVGRGASALFGVGAIAVAFLLGRRWYGTRAGLLGALLLALGIEAAREAALVTPNASLSFLAALALLPIARVAERGRWRDYLAAGAAIGLSVSAKYNSGLLVLSLVAAHLTRGVEGGAAREAAEPRRWRPLLLTLLAAAGVFVLVTPYWVLDFRGYIAGYRLQASHMRTGHVGFMGKPPVVWAVEGILREERTAGLLAFAGGLVALARRAPGDRILLAFVVPSFLAVASLKNQQLDYLAFLWPPAAVLGGRALDALLGWRALGRSRALATAAGALLVAPSLAGAIAEYGRARATDTRTAAREWIEANVPHGSGIAFDRYHYVAPLLDSGRARNSEIGRRHVGGEFASAVETALAGRPTYRLVPLTVPADQPVLPDSILALAGSRAEAVRARIGEDPFLFREFATRNRTLDELRAEGAEYLLVSSRWTDRFLAGAPPSRDNPLFLSWARERADLSRLLADPRLSLLRTWEPRAGLVGPRVTLYKILPG